MSIFDKRNTIRSWNSPGPFERTWGYTLHFTTGNLHQFLRIQIMGNEIGSWRLWQASALAEKSVSVGKAKVFHFSSRLVRLAKFIKGT